MATVGIELSDIGANCVLIGEDGSSRTLAMGGGEDIFPYAYARAGELTFGSVLRYGIRLSPPYVQRVLG